MARVVVLVVLGVAVGFLAGRATAPDDAPAAREPRHDDVAPAQPERTHAPAPPTARSSGDDGESPDPPGSSASTRARRAPRGERNLIRKLVREGYDRRVPDGPPPEADLFEAAVDEARRATELYRERLARNLGAQLEQRQRLRAEVGEIAEFPLVLQLSAPHSADVSLVSRGDAEESPIAPPPSSGSPTAFVRGGTIPPGRVLVVEEVRVRFALGRGGNASLRLDGQEVFKCRGERTVAVRLVGLHCVPHGREQRVALAAYRAAARAELDGRLVTTAEAAGLPDRPLRMAGEGEGFLTDRPAVLQVLADHGGGNPRRVYLDGSTYRIDSIDPGSIWSEEPNLRKRSDSIAHYENCGLVPPGKAYRVTRILYRVILDKQKGRNSRFDIQIGREKIEGNAAELERHEGDWSGDLLLRPGDETKVVVTCHYYGLAEITVFGEVVDPE